MQRQDLESQILDYIKNLYNANYVGRLEVHQDSNIYTFIIGLPSYMSPTVINYETNSDEEFLDFIYEELRKRNYMRLDIYKVTRSDVYRREE